MYILAYLYRRPDSVSDGSIVMGKDRFSKYHCELIRDTVYKEINTREFIPGIYLCAITNSSLKTKTYFYKVILPYPLQRINVSELLENFPTIFGKSILHKAESLSLFFRIGRFHIESTPIDLGFQRLPKFTVVKIPEEYRKIMGTQVIFQYPENSEILDEITRDTGRMDLIQVALKNMGIEQRILERYCDTNNHQESMFDTAIQFGIARALVPSEVLCSESMARLLRLDHKKQIPNLFHLRMYRFQNGKTCELAFFKQKTLYNAILNQRITKEEILAAKEDIAALQEYATHLISVGGF